MTRASILRQTMLPAVLYLASSLCAFGQAAAPAPAPAPAPQAAPAAAVDPAIVAGEGLIGRALFLRGFYLGNDLSYDVANRIEGTPKTGDWTLAGMNVLKANRHGADAIELDGVRVAIRYNPDAHEFQRHPLNDEKMKVLVKLPAETPAGAPQARRLQAAFAAIFAVGIDPEMQRAMPPLWRHYFDPALPWPQDELTGQTIYNMYGLPDQPKDVSPPVLTHKADASFTDAAARDKVKGTVQLRMTIDAEGVPRRLAVVRPLGYGLEEKAAEAMAKWRFSPAMRAGKPVPSAIVVALDFETAPPPPR